MTQFCLYVSFKDDTIPQGTINHLSQVLKPPVKSRRNKVRISRVGRAVAGFSGLSLTEQDSFDHQPLVDNSRYLLTGSFRLNARQQLASKLALTEKKLKTLADSELVLLSCRDIDPERRIILKSDAECVEAARKLLDQEVGEYKPITGP